MNDINLIIKDLKNNIADQIINRIKDSYSTQKYSMLTINDAEKIASMELTKYEEENYINREELISVLNTSDNDLNNLLVDMAIYETNYKMEELEDDKNHFFVRESILSDNCKYNEELYTRVLKAKILNLDYAPSPDGGIYIFRKNIKTLDLSNISSGYIKSLDFRRLRDCDSLTKIKIGKYIQYTHLEEILIRLNKINLEYN